MDDEMDTRFILCIEEIEQPPELYIDTCLFIGYNSHTEKYYLRGKRQRFDGCVPYAFNDASAKEMVNFIEMVVCYNCNITIYNFNNIKDWLEFNEDELTYDFFESHKDVDYEVIGLDEISLKKKLLFKFLKMLKKEMNNN